MRKKRVLFILASNSYSGAENVIITIINNMSDKFCMAYSSPNGDIVRQLSNNNIKYYPLNKMSVSEIKNVIKKFNPDIIHANDFKASFLATMASKNRVVISHIHNNSPWLSKVNIKSFIFLNTIKKSDKVLIVSESIKKEFIFYRAVNDKFVCVGNPVDRLKILNAVNDYKKEYDVCCVARIAPQKNPFRFIEVIKEIKKIFENIKVIWVGNGDSEIEKMVFNMVNEYDLCKNIDFVGFKDNPFTYLAKSKVFLLTSDWEGFGLVAFEALTLGLPCVVSKVGGLVDIVNDKCGMLCNANDNHEYSKEIIRLLSDNKYYKNKSKAAITRSKELENINDYCKTMSNLYFELLDKKRVDKYGKN